jgi:uncharacterized protein (TIGR03437 family)
MYRRGLVCWFAMLVAADAQSVSPAAARASYVSQVIDQAATPAPAGMTGMIIGYLDDFGAVYRTYGAATVDGTVALNEKTLFAIGSNSKVFAATLLAIANEKGLDLKTPVFSMLPSQDVITSKENRYAIRLLDLADHHAGLPKNEAHLYSAVSDLYGDYASDPITCDSSTTELIHDCGCCDPVYMSLLGLTPTCGTGGANSIYSCATHAPTTGANGWLYSNEGFEMLGNVVATWLQYPSWNQANLTEITQPLNMPDTVPIESFNGSQIARAAKHCSPATLTTNVNCQLLDWLPVGNPAGGLFSTASDMLTFLSYNAYGTTGTPANATLANALPIVHQNYESYPGGGQELAWQNSTLKTGELEHWKDGNNGPFNSFTAYVTQPLTRMVVVLEAGATGTDVSGIATQIMVQTGPSISSVVTADGTAGTGIAQNTWTVIKGTNLVPATAPAAGVDWSSAPSFASGQMPTSIGNVSVTVDGKPAYIYFYCSAVTSSVCSSDQINILTPLDSGSGMVDVVVANNGVSSAPFSKSLNRISPAFLLFGAGPYVAATHANGSLLGPASLYPGASTPAKVGEQVVVYGVGFGLPGSAIVNGSSTQSGSLPVLPVCQIGGVAAALSFAGLISPGLYQFNVTVPNVASGDNAIGCTYGGASTPAGGVITVQ